MYQYQMVQVPANLSVKAGRGSQAAADFLQEVVNKHADKGWEFYSVESFGVLENPGCGCLAALFGARPTIVEQQVIVFRAPRN